MRLRRAGARREGEGKETTFAAESRTLSHVKVGPSARDVSPDTGALRGVAPRVALARVAHPEARAPESAHQFAPKKYHLSPGAATMISRARPRIAPEPRAPFAPSPASIVVDLEGYASEGRFHASRPRSSHSPVAIAALTRPLPPPPATTAAVSKHKRERSSPCPSSP